MIFYTVLIRYKCHNINLKLTNMYMKCNSTIESIKSVCTTTYLESTIPDICKQVQEFVCNNTNLSILLTKEDIKELRYCDKLGSSILEMFDDISYDTWTQVYSTRYKNKSYIDVSIKVTKEEL